MSQMFQFGYGDPSNFSDFAKYAGLDRKTGMPTPYDLGPDQGVPPPEDLSGVWQQKVVDPFNKKVANFQQQGTNISNAVDQFGQGNFVKGVNALRATPSNAGTQATTVTTSPWNLSVHFGLD